jgi:hypothetical protein
MPTNLERISRFGRSFIEISNRREIMEIELSRGVQRVKIIQVSALRTSSIVPVHAYVRKCQLYTFLPTAAAFSFNPHFPIEFEIVSKNW